MTGISRRTNIRIDILMLLLKFLLDAKLSKSKSSNTFPILRSNTFLLIQNKPINEKIINFPITSNRIFL